MTRNTLPKCLLLVVAAVFGLAAAASAQLKIGMDGYGETKLPNGIKVIANEDKTTSLTAARIVIGGGVLSETPENNGISNLMIRMLLKGNGQMSAEEITEKLDFYGASVSADCFRDYTAISVVSLSENFDKVMEIISASLTSPTFPEAELAKLKSEVEGEIKATNDDQAAASDMLFWKTVCGDKGYGLPTLGTAESAMKPAVADLKAHYEKYVGGQNMVFAIATDLPAEQIESIIQKRLGGIKSEAEVVQAQQVPLQSGKDGFISYDRNQSYVFMGFVLDRLNAREMACANLLNRVMGGPVGSRLWDLRQKEKLAYAVYTQCLPSRNVTVFRAGIGTDTTKIKQALTSLNREWTKLLAEGITEKELSDARVNLKNNLIYAIDRKSTRANNMAAYEYLGYGYRYALDQIALADQITLEEVNTFVKQRLTEDRKYQSIVGKA